MSETPERIRAKDPAAFSREIGANAARKLKARKSTQGVWFGLGMTGLIGWSVVVPTLAGVALGIWLDKHHPGSHSWTLMLRKRQAGCILCVPLSSGKLTA